MVEDAENAVYQHAGLIFYSEPLNGFSHDTVPDSSIQVFRVCHDNKYLAKFSLGTIDFTNGVPGVASALKDQAVVAVVRQIEQTDVQP